MSDHAQFPYQDSSLSIEQRVEDLLGRMTVEDKAGLMFQPLASQGDLDAPGLFGGPTTRKLIERRINHFNILQAPSAREIAEWNNAIQTEFRKYPLGIPATISSDPRHSFNNNPATAMVAGPFSQFPEMLGFAALDDEDLVRRFADLVRREYLAVGIRTALHPQIDLATEPRWARASATFGESVEITGRLGVAYVLGLQGDELGTESVSAMAKHFPGGGPQLNGEDPHFDYGKEQVYPGGQFDLHLEPFKKVIAAGVSQMMPYYGVPTGTEYEEVGFSFNKAIITDLLREKLGFDGIVCTDWGILSRTFWGVEELTFEERMIKALDAGVDQFGGDFQPNTLVGLVRTGKVTEARLDPSVRRLLREKFRLGLFENPFVDAASADSFVGRPEARKQGEETQAAAHTLLMNGDGPAHLPLPRPLKLYVEGLSARSLAGRATVVATPAEADVAVLRLEAPFEQRGKPGDIDFFFRAGSLAFPAEEIARIRAISETVPTVIDVYLDRPAILTELKTLATSLIVNFGASDDAFVSVLFGERAPMGKLPFDIPSSMAAVKASREDVPFDTADPAFRFGDGMRYQDWTASAAPTADESFYEEPLMTSYDLTSTTFATLLADPAANAIITELVPELPENEMIDIIKGMAFETVIELAGAQLDPHIIAELRTALGALTPPKDAVSGAVATAP